MVGKTMKKIIENLIYLLKTAGPLYQLKRINSRPKYYGKQPLSYHNYVEVHPQGTPYFVIIIRTLAKDGETPIFWYRVHKKFLWFFDWKTDDTNGIIDVPLEHVVSHITQTLGESRYFSIPENVADFPEGPPYNL